MDVVIRQPRLEDGPGLVRAARDLAAQYADLEPERFAVPDLYASLAYFEEELARPPREGVLRLVAEVERETVGEAIAELLEPLPNASIQPQLDVRRRRAYLGYLAVQERHRGKGIGGRLLDAVEAWARERGAELIGTDTNLRSDVGAIEFYERHGYERQAVVLRKSLA
jgi:GNAT superfamily N-acetyltransferase